MQVEERKRRENPSNIGETKNSYAQTSDENIQIMKRPETECKNKFFS
jgi:hypothetical protein